MGGLVKGLFGGGSPKTPPPPKPIPPSAMEIELAKQAEERFNRYTGRYAPLEDAMVAGINRPTERLIEGRSNADVMQEATTSATEAIQAGGIGAGLRSLRGLNTALSRAGASGQALATSGDRAIRDDRALSSIETGIGMSGRQVAGLAELGATENTRAINEVMQAQRENIARIQVQNQASQARASAISGVLGSAAGAFTAHRQDSAMRRRLDQMFRAPALDDFRNYGR